MQGLRGRIWHDVGTLLAYDWDNIGKTSVRGSNNVGIRLVHGCWQMFVFDLLSRSWSMLVRLSSIICMG